MAPRWKQFRLEKARAFFGLSAYELAIVCLSCTANYLAYDFRHPFFVPLPAIDG